jgi:hypothetical protein
MKDIHYNLDALTRIKVHPRYIRKYLKWREESRLFFGLILYRKRGLYDIFDSYLGEDLNEATEGIFTLNEDKEVVTKFSVELTFSDGKSTTKYFDTVEEANKYASEIKEMVKHNWLTIQYA